MSNIVKTDSLHSDEVSIINDCDEFAVLKLVNAYIQEKIKVISDDIWELSLGELKKKGKVDLVDEKLRVAFWTDYERACRNGDQINIHSVARGVINIRSFNKVIACNPFKLAYILTPPENYTVRLEEMLNLALEEERKILELPLIKKKITVKDDGTETVHESVDTSLAMVKHKIRESLQNRVHGSVAQRINQFNVNKNFNMDKKGDEVPLESMDEKALEKYVQEIKEKNELKTVVGGVTDDMGNKGIKEE